MSKTHSVIRQHWKCATIGYWCEARRKTHALGSLLLVANEIQRANEIQLKRIRGSTVLKPVLLHRICFFHADLQHAMQQCKWLSEILTQTKAQIGRGSFPATKESCNEHLTDFALKRSNLLWFQANLYTGQLILVFPDTKTEKRARARRLSRQCGK